MDTIAVLTTSFCVSSVPNMIMTKSGCQNGTRDNFDNMDIIGVSPHTGNDIIPSLSDKQIVLESTSTSTRLKRRLTLINVLSMMLALTGHVAIFIAPGSIMLAAGSILNTFICWVVGSFLVYSLALCFAELGTIYPQAGGPYLYMTKVFGPLPGFMVAWGYIVLISGPFVAFSAHTTSIYIVKSILSEDFCQNQYYDASIMMLSVCVLVALVYLNSNFFRFITRVQTILTVCKITAIFIIIIGGFYILATESTNNYRDLTAGSSQELGKLSLAVIYVIFSNGGWQAVTTLTEEIINPAKVLPLVIHLTFGVYVSVVAVTLAAYLVLLDFNQMTSSEAVALLFCRHLWSPMVPVMAVLVCLATIGALNVGIMGHSRVILAVARNGNLPSIFRTIHHERFTPLSSIAAVGFYGVVMLGAGGTVKMMQFIGLFSLMLGFKMVTALLYLRYTRPELHRPYKAPLLYPVLQAFVCLSLTVLIIYQELAWMSVGILIYLAGIPVYLFSISKGVQLKAVKSIVGRITREFQKFFQQVKS